MSEMLVKPWTPEDELAKIFSGVRSESLTQEDRLKMALIGDIGVGKSWLAATAPKPVVFYDFDDRKESLAGKPGLIIKSRPTMYDVERDLSIAKAAKIQKKYLPATWVFDSVTYMQRAMEEEIFRQAPDLARKIKVGPGKDDYFQVRNGWDTINAIQRYIEYLIAEFSDVGNIIFIFHEKNEKDVVKSTSQQTAYTGEITVDPQYLAKSLSLFNEVYRISITPQGKYECQCRPQWNFGAKTTMFLDKIEEPDIMAMIKKHQTLRAKEQK